jgi:hypothetical protein
VVASSVPINCIQSHPNSAFFNKTKKPLDNWHAVQT